MTVMLDAKEETKKMRYPVPGTGDLIGISLCGWGGRMDVWVELRMMLAGFCPERNRYP